MDAFRAWLGQLQFDGVWQTVVLVAASLLCITFHETCHGWVAYKLGDPTAKRMGRLTLNPLKHVDLAGLIMMAIFRFGWAKPVPVNPRNYKNFKKGEIVVSLAGVTMNLILAVVGAMILYTMLAVNGYKMMTDSVLSTIAIILYYFVGLNCGLIVFNLIPIPPLDGSKLLIPFLPNRALAWFYQYEGYIRFILLVLLIFGALDRPLGAIQSWMMSGIAKAVYAIVGLF